MFSERDPPSNLIKTSGRKCAGLQKHKNFSEKSLSPPFRFGNRSENAFSGHGAKKKKYSLPPLVLARRCPMNSEGIRRRWKWIDAFFVREGYRYEKNSAIGNGEGESLMSPMRI